MSNRNEDFLLFSDWYKILEELSNKHAMMLLRAMVRYQLYDEEPPEFPDKIRHSAILIFSQLKRRKIDSVNGKKGAEARLQALIKKSGEK